MALRSIDQELAAVVHEATKWSGEFARLAQAFSAGIAPDKEQARKVGTQIGEQGKKLKAILDEMEQSKDFQAMEAYYTLEVQARRAKAPSMRAIEQLVNWQAAGLIAFADGRPLAPMPPGVDPTAMQAAAPGTAGGDTKTRVLYEPGTPRMLPFSEDDFDAVPGEAAAFLKAEFQRLSRDHRQLVGLGRPTETLTPRARSSTWARWRSWPSAGRSSWRGRSVPACGRTPPTWPLPRSTCAARA